MSSGGSRYIEEASLDAIRRFQNMLDEDDESDYRVVSTTQQRLDLLLSSPDEIIDVSKPSRIRKTIESSRVTTTFTQRVIEGNGFTLALLLASCILFYLWKHTGKHQHTAKAKTKSPSRETEEKKVSDTISSHAQEPRLHKAVSFRESTGQQDSSFEPRDRHCVGEGEVPPLRAEALQTSQTDTLTMGDNSTATGINVPENSLGTNSLGSNSDLVRSNDASSQIVLQTDVDGSDKTQLLTKLVRDIKLAEDFLAENGLDRSLAQQLAVSMTTSEAAAESQRQLEAQRMMMDHHQRTLDRQLSQRQHEESLHASKYDPNWTEKLEKKRDLCWSTTTRIVFEVLVIHYLSMILKPVMNSFTSQSYLSFQELGRLAIYAICDCGSSTDGIVSSPVSTALFSTPRTLVLFDYIGLNYILAMDAGLCYGHCLLSFGCTAVCVAAIHQGLRILSAPFLVHQIVNVASLALLFGGPNISLEALVSFSKIHMLGIGLLCIFGMVQWNFSNCRRRVQHACKSPTAFPENLETSMQQLDTLYMQLCLVRYAMVTVFCATLFMRGELT
ncbi:unnamed protein product [Cylindrotheca closterium]|uniref:Uncharacterized protein n=1 Tax=Cylindrotheca closterium TaxID=2856 RepID=A0AAD2JM61_9STRA|nr:unnamed protein product [Cylindrotheca closterium]